ncbi:hypothetical protein L1987_14867 [Smallanthus sonchifolius]|uniref:Uncharacterized protein n=1 Tax=Smallanthus sonchifolius TaxID=185202 RepID=A0ACB9J516_9ASTR|nr:hypothetical protein L1987_14867 [Smallanthus sonchifolius]
MGKNPMDKLKDLIFITINSPSLMVMVYEHKEMGQHGLEVHNWWLWIYRFTCELAMKSHTGILNARRAKEINYRFKADKVKTIVRHWWKSFKAEIESQQNSHWSTLILAWVDANMIRVKDESHDLDEYRHWFWFEAESQRYGQRYNLIS